MKKQEIIDIIRSYYDQLLEDYEDAKLHVEDPKGWLKKEKEIGNEYEDDELQTPDFYDGYMTGLGEGCDYILDILSELGK